MAEDWNAPERWAEDVKKYAPTADDGVIAAIVRYCGIALRSRDASLVSFSDPEELARVRDNFLKKKLGLTQPDTELDAAIAKVGEVMKGDNTKNRVTVYYLLLEHLGLTHLFGGAGEAVSGAGAAGAAALGSIALAGGDEVTPAVFPEVAPAPQAFAASPVAGAAAGKSGLGWLPWAVVGLAVVGAGAWYLASHNAPAVPEMVPTELASTVGTASDTVTDLASALPEGQVPIPQGAGVTVETRDGKPVVKVYFDTGKADLVPAFVPAGAGLKAWLDGHAGSSIQVSGFNDKTGNAAANAELSKHRAEAVRDALLATGIPGTAVALVKPKETTDATVSNEAARRVEVTLK